MSDGKGFIIHLCSKSDFLYALRLLDEHDMKHQAEEYTKGNLFFESAKARNLAWALIKPHLTCDGWTTTWEAT